MDIKLPDSTLRKYLQTEATPEKIAEVLTLCGPSVDRLHQVGDYYVYDIEVITNRIDSASAFGIAREAAAILPLFGIKAKLINSPYDTKASKLPERTNSKLELDVEIKDHSLVSRFSLIVLDNITVRESYSPEIKQQLELSGVRSINNLVDITNYLTLCFGQPVHIFDYDKIANHKMILRESLAGEKIITLDGKTHTLKGGDIVIEDGGGRLIDLCGIMGGKLSEVDENTKKAVLFVQTYHPKKIRKTSLYTQERTLAAQIFEKQPDSRLVAPTLIEGVNLLTEYASARVASDSIDIYSQKPISKTITLNIKWLNHFIGHKFDPSTISSILQALGFNVREIGLSIFEADVPSWRLHDITIPEDLAEEIARVYGYFRLASKLPETTNVSVSTEPILNLEYQAKSYLSGFGFTEIFNYSLTGKSIFTKSEIDYKNAISLTNPLTTEFEFMRTSLIPSLLMDLENNQGKSDLPIKIFELANIYLSSKSDNLPEERPSLCLATQGLDYRHFKGYLEALFIRLNLRDIIFRPTRSNSGPWQQNHTADICSGEHLLGTIGVVKPNVESAFRLNQTTCLADINFKDLISLISSTHIYSPISEYPDMIEDITLKSDLPIGELIQSIKVKSQLITKVIYKDSLESKHTFTVHFNGLDKNLSQAEIDQIKSAIHSHLG